MSESCTLRVYLQSGMLDALKKALVFLSDSVEKFWIYQPGGEMKYFTLKEILLFIEKNQKLYDVDPKNREFHSEEIGCTPVGGSRRVEIGVYAFDLAHPSLGEPHLYIKSPLHQGKDDIKDTFHLLCPLILNFIKEFDPQMLVMLITNDIYNAEYLVEYYTSPTPFTFVDEETDKISEKELASSITPEELKKLVKKYKGPYKVLEGKGIGLLKLETNSDVHPLEKVRYVYPRYFIRKELRKRGLKFKDGLAEKYAKELGIK